MPILRSVLREPLVHFLALGALLFAWFHWNGGGSGPGSTRIVVAEGRIQHLAAGFLATWQRPPTEEELKGLIDDYVREEIASREAQAMGLAEDDTIIRRRLRQKLEFLVEDVVEAVPPGDADLQAWLEANPEPFRRDPKLAFRQVYLNPDRHEDPKTDARAVLEQLRRAGPEADIADLGDATMLPAEQPLQEAREVERTFGARFTGPVLELPVGEWSGPVASGFGWHLVLVTEKRPPELPPLAEIRPAVERDLLAMRRKEQVDRMYEELLGKYTVVVDWPAWEGTTGDAPPDEAAPNQAAPGAAGEAP